MDLTPSTSARSGRPSTIAEDNEMDSLSGPIFPDFSNSSTQERMPDESAADQIPYPVQLPGFGIQRQKQKDIKDTIQKDFDKEFQKDNTSVIGVNTPYKMPDEIRKSMEFGKGADDNSASSSESELAQSKVTPSKSKSVSFREDTVKSSDASREGEESYMMDDLSLSKHPDKTNINDKKQSTLPSLESKIRPVPSTTNKWWSGFSHKRDKSGSSNLQASSSNGKTSKKKLFMEEAKELVHQHIRNRGNKRRAYSSSSDRISLMDDDDLSDIEDNDTSPDDDYLPRTVRSGVASNLMKLYGGSTSSFVDDDYSNNDGFATKAKRKTKEFTNMALQPILSGSSKNKLHKSKASSKIKFNMPTFSKELDPTEHKQHDRMNFRRKLRKKHQHDTTARVTVHIADILERQKFLLTLCKAFMEYGAPNHRLEEYLKRTARVLELDAAFVYFPNIIIVSFGDPSTKTSEVKVIRVNQGFNLAKLDDAHEIYKSVVHDRMGVEEASQKLDQLIKSKSYFNKFWLIVFYGLSSAFIIIWFNGSWQDMGPSFLMGCLVGFFQLVIAPKSTLYSSVFEVCSSIFLSFIGRAIGSIKGGRIFCFSAIVQSGLAMILPGYTIMSGALEIQSRSIVSGTVRMFYAIIFSLLLGFGITLGSALYGWIDKGAINTTTCSTGGLAPMWNLLFIPAFTVFATLGVEARWSQLPPMVIIASAGYAVYYFSAKHFSIAQFNAALGAFTVGLLSNLYSRFGMPFKRFGYCSSAFTTMYPGIIDLVPGSVASRNVLAAGITQLTKAEQNSTTGSQNILNDSTLTFGVTMIEVSIGISVGLFLSAIVVYPIGKKRTGIFSL